MYTEAEGYKQSQAAEFYDRLRRTTAALPGVQSVTLAGHLPLFGSDTLPIQIPGTDAATSQQTAVDDAYFATLGIPIVAGRAFNPNDREKTPAVAIVNRRMADMYWKSKNPLGEVLMVGKPLRPVTIVGVAANTKNDTDEEKPGPFIYLPLSQDYRSGIEVIARTSGDPKRWVQPFRQAMRSLGLKVMIEPVTFAEWVDLDLLGMRVITWGGQLLSGLGLLLAMVGLAGAVSYSVGQRKRARDSGGAGRAARTTVDHAVEAVGSGNWRGSGDRARAGNGREYPAPVAVLPDGRGGVDGAATRGRHCDGVRGGRYVLVGDAVAAGRSPGSSEARMTSHATRIEKPYARIPSFFPTVRKTSSA